MSPKSTAPLFNNRIPGKGGKSKTPWFNKYLHDRWVSCTQSLQTYTIERDRLVLVGWRYRSRQVTAGSGASLTLVLVCNLRLNHEDLGGHIRDLVSQE